MILDKEHSPFYYHNKALREHPEYQMEGMLDCLREEMMLNMPYPKEVFEYPKRVTQKEPIELPQGEQIHYHFRMPAAPKRKSKYD